MQTSINSKKEIKTCCKKFEKTLLVVPLSLLHAKQLLIELLFENQLTNANQLLRFMLANYIHIRCVNLYRPVIGRVRASIQRQVFLRLDKIGPAGLKKCSRPIFNDQDQNVKSKASLQPADRRKLTALVLMGFILFATFCSEPWVAFNTSVPINKYDVFSLKRMFNVLARRRSSVQWDDNIYRRRTSMLLKCGVANGAHCTTQPIVLNNIYGNTFLTGVYLQLSIH